MTDKTVSKYLLNLEKHFAHDNPVLLKASKVFHQLDQLEFDLGLIQNDETTAANNTWWPVISLIGGNSTAKSRFINNVLGTEHLLAGIQPSSHKFTVLLQNSQANTTTLPGSALDVDIRYPFYQISRKIEQQQKGEGKRINSYLELKTLNSPPLKGKLFIDAPNMAAAPITPVTTMLTRYVVDHSDLVLVFADVFDTHAPLVEEFTQIILDNQDSSKFVYLIEEPPAFMTPINKSEVISSWQRKLAGLGINSGQYIVLPNPQNNKFHDTSHLAEIDMRLTDVGNDRSYRVLDALEKNIEDIEYVVVAEVRKALLQWKERVNISSLLVLALIVSLLIFAEIETGILDMLIDPIIGPIALAVLIGVMVPVHLLGSRLQAKLIVAKLKERQQELAIMEDLAGLFEKSLTPLRMLLPFTEPVGWNKKTKAQLHKLDEKTKSLVQALNDSFGSYDDIPNTYQEIDDFTEFG